MPYALGVDIGTSTLTTATFRLTDRDDPVVSTLELGSRGVSSTSVAMTDDGRLMVGDDAEREAAIHPERVVRGWSRRLGDTVPIAFGVALVDPAAIFAAVVRWAVLEAERREGAAPASVCVTHPTGWGEYRIWLLRRALADAGMGDVVVVDELDAALAQHRRMWEDADGPVGIYDLSADRVSFSLIEKTDAGRWRRLAGETLDDVGGARFDDAVLAHVIAGAGDALSRFDTTADGSMTHMHVLRHECNSAKESLSEVTEVSVPARFGGVDASVRMTRDDFDGAVEVTLRRTVHVVREAQRRAGLPDGTLCGVLLIGGASSAPLVEAMISAELAVPVVADENPQETISFGAARIAAERVDWSAAAEETAETARERGVARASVSRVYAAAAAAIQPFARRLTAGRRERTSLPLTDTDRLDQSMAGQVPATKQTSEPDSPPETTGSYDTASVESTEAAR